MGNRCFDHVSYYDLETLVKKEKVAINSLSVKEQKGGGFFFCCHISSLEGWGSLVFQQWDAVIPFILAPSALSMGHVFADFPLGEKQSRLSNCVVLKACWVKNVFL